MYSWLLPPFYILNGVIQYSLFSIPAFFTYYTPLRQLPIGTERALQSYFTAAQHPTEQVYPRVTISLLADIRYRSAVAHTEVSDLVVYHCACQSIFTCGVHSWRRRAPPRAEQLQFWETVPYWPREELFTLPTAMPVFPHPHKHNVLSHFWVFTNLINIQCCFFNCISLRTTT